MDRLLKVDQANIRIIHGLCLLKKDPAHAIFYLRWRVLQLYALVGYYMFSHFCKLTDPRLSPE